MFFLYFQWFEEKHNQIETLDQQLKKLHAASELLVVLRKGLFIGRFFVSYIVEWMFSNLCDLISDIQKEKVMIDSICRLGIIVIHLSMTEHFTAENFTIVHHFYCWKLHHRPSFLLLKTSPSSIIITAENFTIVHHFYCWKLHHRPSFLLLKTSPSSIHFSCWKLHHPGFSL